MRKGQKDILCHMLICWLNIQWKIWVGRRKISPAVKNYIYLNYLSKNEYMIFFDNKKPKQGFFEKIKVSVPQKSRDLW